MVAGAVVGIPVRLVLAEPRIEDFDAAARCRQDNRIEVPLIPVLACRGRRRRRVQDVHLGAGAEVVGGRKGVAVLLVTPACNDCSPGAQTIQRRAPGCAGRSHAAGAGTGRRRVAGWSCLA